MYCLSLENYNDDCMNKCDSRCKYEYINSGICYGRCNSSSWGIHS